MELISPTTCGQNTRHLRTEIEYKTRLIERTYLNHLFQLEVVENLGVAIDQLCEMLDESEQAANPFAGDLCPYFGVLWEAAEGLAQFISKHPELFQNQKILEIGCGLGLPSMVSTLVGGKVLASDFHPSVENFFKNNLKRSGIQCQYEELNWLDKTDRLGKFDIVLGADILYESRHAYDVAEALIHYVASGGKMILADPDRGQLKRFREIMSNKGFTPRIYEERVNEQSVFIHCFQAPA